MSATPDSTLADPQKLIADLQQQLAECRAERDEALARETATAKILQVINSSPGNLAPVFDAMLEKAMRLCGAAFGELHIVDGQQLKAVALRGVPPAHAEYRRNNPSPATPGTVTGRLFAGMDVIEIADLRAEDAYCSGEPQRRAVVDLGGARSAVAVALRRGGTLLGGFFIYRQEVRPFTDKQIALLQNFAAQAVIAIENARLLGELRERTDELAARNSEFAERIEHQSATISVLKEMAASPGDAQPVFDLITRQARELCGTPSAVLLQYDGELVHVRAMSAEGDGWGELLARYESNFPMVPTRSSLACRAILDGQIVHIRDLDGEPGIGDAIRALGHRTSATVPMMRDGRAIGAIATAALEVDAFSPGDDDGQEQRRRCSEEQSRNLSLL